MSPVFAHGHLRLYLLGLLGERPMHGYELIQELGDRFGGTYSPSAGTIYPRLSKLRAEGLISRRADGRKTVYTITDAGRAELRTRRHELDGIENGVTSTVRHLADRVRADVDDAMRSVRADLAAAARETRSGTRQEASVDSTAVGVASQRELQEAELALNEFRQLVRSELRRLAAGDAVPVGTAVQLKTKLDAITEAFTNGATSATRSSQPTTPARAS